MLKNIYKIILLFILFLYIFTVSVKAEIRDNSNLFTDMDEEVLNKSILDFKESTGYDICIEVLSSIPEERDFEEFATEKYLEVFPDEAGIYYLISSSDGNIIIKYKEFDEIVTKELISVMLLSMNTDFEKGEILDGILSSIQNGKTLILENQKEAKDREANHEVLEAKNNLLDIHLIICIICGIVFVGNFIYLFVSRSKNI